MRGVGFATAEQIERITQLQKLTGANLYKLAEGLGFKLKALDFLTYNQAELLIELLEKVWDEKRRKEEPQVVVVKKAPLWLKVVGYVWVYFLRPALRVLKGIVWNLDVLIPIAWVVWLVGPLALAAIGNGIELIFGKNSAVITTLTEFNRWLNETVLHQPMHQHISEDVYEKGFLILSALLPPSLFIAWIRGKKDWERERAQRYKEDPIAAAYEDGYNDGKADGFFGGYWMGRWH